MDSWNGFMKCKKLHPRFELSLLYTMNVSAALYRWKFSSRIFMIYNLAYYMILWIFLWSMHCVLAIHGCQGIICQYQSTKSFWNDFYFKELPSLTAWQRVYTHFPSSLFSPCHCWIIGQTAKYISTSTVGLSCLMTSFMDRQDPNKYNHSRSKWTWE